MEIRELLKAPQLFIVYAITLLYTVTFSLAAVIGAPKKVSPYKMYQVAKIEAAKFDQPEVIRNNSSG